MARIDDNQWVRSSPETIKGLSFVGLFLGAGALYFGFVSAFTCATPGEAAYYATCPSVEHIAIDLLPSFLIILLSILGFLFAGRIARSEAGRAATRQ